MKILIKLILISLLLIPNSAFSDHIYADSLELGYEQEVLVVSKELDKIFHACTDYSDPLFNIEDAEFDDENNLMLFDVMYEDEKCKLTGKAIHNRFTGSILMLRVYNRSGKLIYEWKRSSFNPPWEKST